MELVRETLTRGDTSSRARVDGAARARRARRRARILVRTRQPFEHHGGGRVMNCSQSLVVAAFAAATCGVVTPSLAQVGKSVTIVDANVATEQQLCAIPQLVPALVKSILARRPFPSITELDALLSQALAQEPRAAVYGRLFVHLNLNGNARANPADPERRAADRAANSGVPPLQGAGTVSPRDRQVC